TRLPLPSMLQYPAHPEYHTLSLHDALPIFIQIDGQFWAEGTEEQRIQLNAGALHTENAKTVELRYADLVGTGVQSGDLNSINMRSEEHTSELQSRENLVCRLLLEKKHTHLR